MNSLIEKIFADFKVNNKSIPVSFLRYEGKATTYITYQQVSIGDTLSGDDEIIGYIDYYDVDIFSKGNYLNIVKEVKKIMKANGFMWQPSNSSEDMYEEDTGYFHKTLNFAIERMEE
jgi:hypothetical protein